MAKDLTELANEVKLYDEVIGKVIKRDVYPGLDWKEVDIESLVTQSKEDGFDYTSETFHPTPLQALCHCLITLEVGDRIKNGYQRLGSKTKWTSLASGGLNTLRVSVCIWEKKKIKQ